VLLLLLDVATAECSKEASSMAADSSFMVMARGGTVLNELGSPRDVQAVSMSRMER